MVILCLNCGLTLTQTTYFRLFQTEKVYRRQFKFNENGRRVSKWVENTLGKEEIVRYEQFLLFKQCVQNTSLNSEYLWPDPFPDFYLCVCNIYILYGLKKQKTAIKYV